MQDSAYPQIPQGRRDVISQQPQPQQRPNLTPEEQEQFKGVQKWAEIRKERRIAMGVPAEDEKPKKKEKEEKEERKDEDAEKEKSAKCWTCLTCCCLCSNCYC